MTNRPTSTAPPGRMTAAMRAMPRSTGPRLLRVALVRDGRVIEERVVDRGANVTIGPSENSTFLIPEANLPPAFRLFERVGGEYALAFFEDTEGRLDLRSGVFELAELRRRARRAPLGRGHYYQVPITEEARGKVVLGDTTVLFQFVASASPRPKPKLPASFDSGFASNIDRTTTAIAAFSFLFHFGAVGSLYSDWVDPVVDEHVDVAQLVLAFDQLESPPPVEQKLEVSDAPATAPTAAVAPQKPTSGGSGAKGPGSGVRMVGAEATAISAALDQLNVAMVGALANTGSATKGVLTANDMPLGLVDDAAASSAGAISGSSAGLSFGPGAARLPRPGESHGLGEIGNTTAAPARVGATEQVKRPTGSTQVDPATVLGGNVPNASAVVAQMASGFRRCYMRGLDDDPSMRGSVRISARIGPNGEVLAATPSGGGGLSGAVIACVVGRVRSAEFAPPEGGGATIVIPVKFVSQ